MDLIHALVDRHVASGGGDRLALAAPGGRLTYRDLQRRLDARAKELEGLGVAAGDRVVLRLPNTLELAVLWLALQRVGATAVTTPPAWRARELSAVLAGVAPRLAIAAPDTHAELDDALGRAGSGSASATLDGTRLVASRARPRAEDTPPADMPTGAAIVAYTNSTAAEAHGCCHSAASILAAADAYGVRTLGLTGGDVAGGAVPLWFTYGLGALLVMPLAAGGAATIESKFDANRLIESIAADRVTVLFGTATSYRLLLQIPGFERRGDISSLRLCVSAGEPLDAATAAAWRVRTGIALVDSLGSTEMFHVYVSQRPDGATPGTIGGPVPGYEIRLVDEASGADVAPGAAGRLLVRGPTSCRYWRRPDLDRAWVRDGWHVTGDLACREPGGDVRFLRRADDLIVSAGYNVSAAEVASVLASHPAVAGVRVAGVPDPIRGRVVKAWVTAKAGVTIEGLTTVLQAHAAGDLAAYKCPRKYAITRLQP